jgi:hypothetical protein
MRMGVYLVKNNIMNNQPTYNITASVNGDILEIVATGDIAEPDTRKIMMREIIDVEKSTNVKKQLLDVRQLNGRLGTVEIYNYVRDYPPDRPRMKVALVDTSEYAQIASFHETTAVNAGLSCKWFTDINEARMWLKSK